MEYCVVPVEHTTSGFTLILEQILKKTATVDKFFMLNYFLLVNKCTVNTAVLPGDLYSAIQLQYIYIQNPCGADTLSE